MTIGVAVLCRYTSQRLPGKILREIKGRAVLGHILDRVRRGAPECPVVVCTSSDPSDDPIYAYAKREGVDCFRGPLNDVSGRFLACAEAHGWEFSVRINGDNVFADPDSLREMVAIAGTGAFDFVTNVPGRTFPYGTSIEIVRTDFYRHAMKDVPDPGHHEHVTSWLYENPDLGRQYWYKNSVCPEADGLQLALDTEGDLELASKIMARMERAPETYNLREIVNLVNAEREPRSPWKGRCGPLLIAEIGGNHEGDFETAKDLTRKAIEAGPDYVKFQLYRGDSLVSPVESPDRNAHFKRFELSREQHIELAEMCAQAGVGYMASVWDLEMLEWIDPWLSVYKIGSGDLTAFPLVREMARRGKPIILSTGLANFDEVLQTVAQIQAVDGGYSKPERLCLLQCTSMYPISEREAELRVMDVLRQKTGVAVGYSDHTEGGLALRVAAAMGAEVLEFHFTDKREGRTFRDHKVSLTGDELDELREDLQRINALRGSGTKVPQPAEVEEGHVVSFRRAVYLTKDLEVGERIKPEDVTLLRPNHGIDARDADYVVGGTVCERVRPYERLDYDSIARG
ncbi:MAG TPA: N-acetylneuraminate synthase family protein [Alphaproteobacteria bacterium]|nr:N-acetylneuraminate synthase family protein [Alphaproteobacteria bacterium]